MEEEKAAAYYDELTRKGEGAARFKQGLGFSASSDSAPPARGSAFVSASSASSSSFLGSFVRASSPTKTSQLAKQSQLESIQNKLRKKPDDADRHRSRVSDRSEREDRGSRRHRSRSAEREREKRSRRRSRSRDGDRHREKDRDRDRDRNRDRDRDRDRRRRSRSGSRSASPRRSGTTRGASPRERRGSEKSRSGYRERKEMERSGKEQNGGKAVDYSRLIDGYDKMTAAEKVKAKMKLQLAETAEKDESNGMGPGWERFEFDKDAPLDDEEIEAAEDDGALVKHIGQSFRFSAVEARREEQIKTAHDEAMFGSSRTLSVGEQEPNVENENNSVENIPVASLVSEKVLARQQGSWRDRARKA